MKSVKRGARGDLVRKLQRRLIHHGYALKVDGDFGPTTERFVKRFQHDHGLKVDGKVGARSWRALDQKNESEPVAAPPRPPVGMGGHHVSESHLIRRLKEFGGFGYALEGAAYPYPLGGVPGLKLATKPGAAARVNNCCTFVEALLVKAWSDSADGFRWNKRRHGQFMIASTADYFSPITAVVEAGMGVEQEDPDMPPAPWTLVQGWRRKWGGGHTFLVLDIDGTRILTLESNSYYGLNGPGFRHVGGLDDFDGFRPSKWKSSRKLWDWKRFRKSYPHMRLARLKVRDIQWMAGQAAGDETAGTPRFVWSKNSKLFHLSTCSLAKRIASRNRATGTPSSKLRPHKCVKRG